MCESGERPFIAGNGDYTRKWTFQGCKSSHYWTIRAAWPAPSSPAAAICAAPSATTPRWLCPGYAVKLDTNGTFPARLRAIVEAGLADRVAMDIKASPERYAAVTGVPGLDLGPIKESVAYLMACGVDYEFRTTAVKGLHLPEDFEGIGRWIAGAMEYYIQGFKDSGDLIAAQGLSEFSEAEMQRLADIVRPYVPAVKLRGV